MIIFLLLALLKHTAEFCILNYDMSARVSKMVSVLEKQKKM